MCVKDAVSEAHFFHPRADRSNVGPPAESGHPRRPSSAIATRYYPVPTDGACGEIMRAAKRSVTRPQHVHFWLHAEGHQPLITQLFFRDDPYIGRDAVFADQTSLQADFVRHESGTAPDGSPLGGPFVTLDWTLTLAADDRVEEAGQCRG